MKSFSDRFVISSLAVLLLFAAGDFLSVVGQAKCAGDDIFTAKSCDGDANSSEEKKLLELINSYRAANKKPEVAISASLSMVANRRMLDLKQNLRTLTHSWSNCPYDFKNEKTWPCVTGAPVRLKSGYDGKGYETLYRTSKGNVKPELALDAWKKSQLHISIILNLDMFGDLAWNEVGLAISGEYASVWFGHPSVSPAGAITLVGLGKSYDETVAGLTKILSIDKASSTVENNKWLGYSADKRIKLEMYGIPANIAEVNLAIAVKLEPDKKLGAQSRLALVTLLKNIFPEWTGREEWLENMIAAIAVDRTFSRTKLVRKIAVELRADGSDSIKLIIQPESQQKYIQIF